MTIDDLRVQDNPNLRRYEARLADDRVVAFSEYRRLGDRIVFIHTETDPRMVGRGIAGRLVEAALDDVRRRGLLITVKCPYIRAWLRRHPEYADLVAFA